MADKYEVYWLYDFGDELRESGNGEWADEENPVFDELPDALRLAAEWADDARYQDWGDAEGLSVMVRLTGGEDGYYDDLPIAEICLDSSDDGFRIGDVCVNPVAMESVREWSEACRALVATISVGSEASQHQRLATPEDAQKALRWADEHLGPELDWNISFSLDCLSWQGEGPSPAARSLAMMAVLFEPLKGPVEGWPTIAIAYAMEEDRSLLATWGETACRHLCVEARDPERGESTCIDVASGKRLMVRDKYMASNPRWDEGMVTALLSPALEDGVTYVPVGPTTLHDNTPKGLDECRQQLLAMSAAFHGEPDWVPGFLETAMYAMRCEPRIITSRVEQGQEGGPRPAAGPRL